MSIKEAGFEELALNDLEATSVAEQDALPFGVVGFAADTPPNAPGVTGS